MDSRVSGRTRGRLRHRAREDARSSGQSLAEFALVLPIILFLTLIALDFGRVYLGWINLQNMARIAANYAANDPAAWDATPDTASQTRYRNQILADAAATNCALPTSGGAKVVPAPTFTDINGGGVGLGDTVSVRLTCTFSVITPFVSNVLGGSVNVSASSSFPVKSGVSALVVPGGGGGGVPSAPNAAFSANDVFTPGSISNTSPFVVDFRDTSGGVPTSWSWNFGDGTPIVTTQDALGHSFTCSSASCPYTVVLTVANAHGTTSTSMVVTVVGSTTVNFTSNKQSGDRPLTVTFTDASTPGATAWSWSFGDGTTASGSTVTHTYSSTSGSPYSVTLTVTYPSPTGTKQITKVGYITVNVGMCTVPSLNGVKFNSATGVWQGAPNNFTGTVLRATGAPNGNFTITAQDLAATSVVPCNSNITVNAP